jgi:hypothetical protein
LNQDESRLDLHAPGRASFTISATEAVRGLATLDIGYNEGPLQRHFLGYVERCTAANSTCCSAASYPRSSMSRSR